MAILAIGSDTGVAFPKVVIQNKFRTASISSWNSLSLTLLSSVGTLDKLLYGFHECEILCIA